MMGHENTRDPRYHCICAFSLTPIFAIFIKNQGFLDGHDLTSSDIYHHDEISFKTAGEGAGLGY